MPSRSRLTTPNAWATNAETNAVLTDLNIASTTSGTMTGAWSLPRENHTLELSQVGVTLL